MPTRIDKHTISITQAVKDRLDGYRNRTHPSYDDLLNDLMDFFDANYSEER